MGLLICKCILFSIFISSFNDLPHPLSLNCFISTTKSPTSTLSLLLLICCGLWSLMRLWSVLTVIESDLWLFWLYGIPYMVRLWPPDLQLRFDSILAERLAVLWSKGLTVRINRSKAETLGNEAMKYGLPFTAKQQCHHSVHTQWCTWKEKRETDNDR